MGGLKELEEYCKINGLTFTFGPNSIYVKMPDDVILRRSYPYYNLLLEDTKEYYEQTYTKGVKEKQ